MPKNSKSYRLVYIWVQEHKNIQNAGLSLTLDYAIEKFGTHVKAEQSTFNMLANQRLKELDSFCALVGKNGSGKSHFLHIIRKVLSLGHFPKGMDGFAIFESNSTDKSLQMLTSKKDKYTFISGSIVEYLDLNQTYLVDYNPFENNFEDTSLLQSSLHIKGNPILTSKLQREVIEGASQFALSRDDLELFDVLSSVKNNPHACFVVRYSELLESVISMLPRRLTRNSKLEKTWMREFNKYFLSLIKKKNVDIEMFSLCFLFLYWYELLQKYKKELKSINATCSEAALAFVMIDCIREELHPDIAPFIKDALNYFNKPINPNVSSFYAHHSLQVLSRFNELIKLNSNVYQDSDLGYCIRIPFSDVDFLTRFIFDVKFLDIDAGKKVSHIVSENFVFKKIYVTGLSSGEKQIIHFLGELKKYLLSMKGKQGLILIDEIEASFHPEWQRNLVRILSELFSNVAEKVGKVSLPIQVVIVTHSPFILSDILNGKTLALGCESRVNWKTFGANIHDLLSQSFFMEKNIGESAAKVIIECARELDQINGEVSGEKYDTIKYTIESISDSLIRTQLESRLSSMVRIENDIKSRLKSLLSEERDDEDVINELKKIIGDR
ncbi:ATPase_AAA_core domain-containing protein [Vibrio owensii]|uniref:ATPase_AAA_core domain-containing protein n=1 Tax=Vibrio owensii TaxID=696485 RepID=A0AAU9Q522_9VIBR|nr:ATPase_AAA_core domain-containing protein [Vibrio owensii]